LSFVRVVLFSLQIQHLPVLIPLWLALPLLLSLILFGLVLTWYAPNFGKLATLTLLPLLTWPTISACLGLLVVALGLSRLPFAWWAFGPD
jgi:tryptophan-rich sensory protein